MPKIKLPRSSPKLDMTPMVDLAFLLVTFFMLTTQFKADEPVTVTTPSSVSELSYPEKDVLTITVDNKGRAFIDMDNKYIRLEWITRMNDQYDLQLSNDNMQTFAVLKSFGVPLEQLKSYLEMDPEQRKKVQLTGIPMDSIVSEKNQLAQWVLNARGVNGNLAVGLKADATTPYVFIKDIMNTLHDDRLNVDVFNLITNLEQETKS